MLIRSNLVWLTLKLSAHESDQLTQREARETKGRASIAELQKELQRLHLVESDLTEKEAGARRIADEATQQLAAMTDKELKGRARCKKRHRQVRIYRAHG